MFELAHPISGVTYPPPTLADEWTTLGYWAAETAGDLVRRQSKARGEHPFVISDEGVLSFRNFDEKTDVVSKGLCGIGLRAGDRALFQMGTVPETLIALFACYKAGVIPVCSLPQYRQVEMDALARLSSPKAYFVQSDFHPDFDLCGFAHEIARAADIPRVIACRSQPNSSGTTLDEVAALAGDVPSASTASTAPPPPSPRDVLTFQLSGGSTGIPKIIPRLHGEYIGQAASVVRRYALSETDVAIWPLPLIHNAAMVMAVFPMLICGGTLVLRSRFDLDDYLGTIERYGVTYAGSIGPIAPSLLDCDHLQQFDLKSLRLFFALERAAEIEARIGVRTVNLYGITEGLLMSCGPDDPASLRGTSTGHPTSAGDRIRLLAPTSGETIHHDGDGELCFSGPHAIRSYVGGEGVSRLGFTDDGFVRTGDLVRREHHEGRAYYTFLGRLKDNINRGGEKFGAEEVERLVAGHPAIADVRIVAMPDPFLGEKACAFVIPRRGAPCPDVAELGRFLTEIGLARFKHPERIEIVTAFPVTRVGKVDKAALREAISAKLAGEGSLARSRPRLENPVSKEGLG